MFVVDIEFDYEKATDRQIMYNEIFPHTVDKKAVLQANERSLFQLLELYSEDIKGTQKNYKVTPKSQATLFPKRCIPMIFRCGWKVTKLYKHYYFEQKRFKRDFILMNQKAWQEDKNSIESDFCKLLNNANFGFDCRNNLDNCVLEPVNDEVQELSFVRKYHRNLFDKELAPFVNLRILQEEITQRFNDERQKIVESDPFYSAKIRSIENRRFSKQDALDKFKQKNKKNKKRTILQSYSERIDIANKNQKIKTIIDFSDQDTASLKSLGVKTTDKVKITTRLVKGKMLMFSKISLRAFLYDLIDHFCFPDDEVQEIYARNEILRCFIYLILTDTDSCSIQFLFISNLKSTITDKEAYL